MLLSSELPKVRHLNQPKKPRKLNMVIKNSLKTAVLGAVVALGATVLAPTSGFAGVEASDGKKQVVAPEAPVQSWITGDIGDTVTNEYISRGIVLENQGVINQPYLDLFFKVYEGKGFINSVSVQLSFWSSIHTKSRFAGAGSTTKNWYEFDWDPGITMTFLKNWTYTVQYFEFDSPSDSFQPARSINQTIALNDSDMMGTFALHPHVTVLAEIPGDGRAGTGNHEGWYFEQGIAPSYTLMPKSEYPITLTFPITGGEGTKEFYSLQAPAPAASRQGTNFGFVSAGVTVSVPLAFVPKQIGSWTASAGYTAYYIGEAVASLSPVSHAPFDTKGGPTREDQHVFQATLGVTF